jgi:hypothetical protein
MEDVIVKLNPELLWQKLHLTRSGLLFTGKMDWELRKQRRQFNDDHDDDDMDQTSSG